MRALLAVGCLTAGLLGWSPPAAARDMTGKAGLGLLAPLVAERDIRTPMFSFRYWRTSVAIELLVGFDSVVRDFLQNTNDSTADAGDSTAEVDGSTAEVDGSAAVSDPVRVSTLRTGFTLLWRVLDRKHVSASIGPRLWLSYTDLGERAELDVRGELPFQVEYFLSDNASIIGAVGPVIFTAGSLDEEGFLLSETGVTLALFGGFRGGLGLTYYF